MRCSCVVVQWSDQSPMGDFLSQMSRSMAVRFVVASLRCDSGWMNFVVRVIMGIKCSKNTRKWRYHRTSGRGLVELSRMRSYK